MRISDWSSDVCSSDLGKQPGSAAAIDRQRLLPLVLHCQGIEHPNRHQQTEDMAEQDEKDADMEQHRPPHQLLAPQELDRKSVVSGKSVSVRVDLGGRRIIKKQKLEISNKLIIVKTLLDTNKSKNLM